MKSAFRPPKLNPMVVGFVKTVLPWLMASPAFAIRTRFDPKDIERLKAYQGKRMLLLPNHPSSEDPLVMLDLSKQVGENFNYVAAREVFELYKGFNGWLLQRCGVYSVIRGKADRDSFRTTRQLLAEGQRRLTIFIEGEVSSENDTLIPFEAGVLQLAFWALDDLSKQIPKESLQSLPPLFAVPVAIKYYYDDGVEQVVQQALGTLEKATGLPVQNNESPYLRIRALGQVILSVHEKALNIHPEADSSIAARVATVKERLLGQMERYLAIQPPKDQSYLDRIRAVRNVMDALAYSYEDIDELSEYEKHKIEMRQKTFASFYRHLTSLVNFLTFQEGRVIEQGDQIYVPDHFNPERMMELLHRLEKEILGSVVTRHPKTAIVKVGEIRNLTEIYPTYEKGKKATVQQLANDLETEMTATLKNIPKPDKRH